MKRNIFVGSIIAFVIVISLLASNYITLAQRLGQQAPNKPTMVIRPGVTSTFILTYSWLALSLEVGIDSETLAKAHPIYQEVYNDIKIQGGEVDKKYEPQLNELRNNPPVDREEGGRRARALLRQRAQEMMNISEKGMNKITTSLEEILSEAQMLKLKEETKKLLKEQERRSPKPPSNAQ